MTPEEALHRLQALPDAYYEGQAHPDEATQVLCQLLASVGYPALVEAYAQASKTMDEDHTRVEAERQDVIGMEDTFIAMLTDDQWALFRQLVRQYGFREARGKNYGCFYCGETARKLYGTQRRQIPHHSSCLWVRVRKNDRRRKADL